MSTRLSGSVRSGEVGTSKGDMHVDKTPWTTSFAMQCLTHHCLSACITCLCRVVKMTHAITFAHAGTRSRF